MTSILFFFIFFFFIFSRETVKLKYIALFRRVSRYESKLLPHPPPTPTPKTHIHTRRERAGKRD